MANVLRRFQAACFFAIGLSIALIYMVLAEDVCGPFIYYFTAGFLLSLMLSLWNEEFHNKRVLWTIAVAAHALLLVDAFILWNAVDSYFDTELYIARTALYVALILGILFLPFYSESNDVKSWNFTRRLLIAFLISFLIGMVMTMGIGILLWSMQNLFGLDIDDKVFETIIIIFYQFLPMMLFLSRIPQGESKHDTSIVTSRFLTGTTRYLFIPLVACYMLVLYGYLVLILINWELPQGTVSWLVSYMMFGIIIIEFLLYPTMRKDDTRGFERWVVRWFPLLALPLVILMTVGIVRRFNDYGITVNRLYILTGNLWYYVICIGLFILKARRIHWIPLSFGALLLLTSAQPMNYCEIVKRNIRSKIDSLIAQYTPEQLPMEQPAYDAWLLSMPKETRKEAQSLLDYLHRNYNNQTGKWIDEMVYINKDVSFGETNYPAFSYKSPHDYIELPDGYRKLQKESGASVSGYDDNYLNDSTFVLRTTSIDDNPISFEININELKRKTKQNDSPVYFPEESCGDSIIVTFGRFEYIEDEFRTMYDARIFYK